MTKDLHGVEIKHPHASAGHHFPHADHTPHPTHAGPPVAHHAAHQPTVHYHNGPEHHHYHAPSAAFTTPRPGHFIRDGQHPHHPPQVEHTRHHYNIVPHWDVNKPRKWRNNVQPWRDEVGVWHHDHRIFVDDEGTWWDDFGRWRDAEGFWHLPDEVIQEGVLPPPVYHHPFDSVINNIIAHAADYVTEKVAEEQTKAEEIKKEGEKKND